MTMAQRNQAARRRMEELGITAHALMPDDGRRSPRNRDMQIVCQLWIMRDLLEIQADGRGAVDPDNPRLPLSELESVMRDMEDNHGVTRWFYGTYQLEQFVGLKPKEAK